MLTSKAIVRNVITNDLYEYIGDNKFMNLRTKKSGRVTDEAAAKTFKINLEATKLLNEYPLIGEMISRLNLKFCE